MVISAPPHEELCMTVGHRSQEKCQDNNHHTERDSSSLLLLDNWPPKQNYRAYLKTENRVIIIQLHRNIEQAGDLGNKPVP